MEKEFFDLLDKYIEAKIDLEFAKRERDEDGYSASIAFENELQNIKSEILEKFVH